MALTGSETLQVLGQDGAGHPAATTQQTTTGAIAALASLDTSNNVITALNTVGAGTITAAGIVGKITVRGGSQSGTAFSDTTDTAAHIIAALPSGAAVGTSFQYTYQNLTNAVATIGGGTDVTVSGLTVIPANGFVRYLVTYSAAATVTMVGFEEGGFSADATDSTKVVGFNASGQTTGTTALIATQNTANATYTLPAATDTLAALGTAETFTAAQTFSGGLSTGVVASAATIAVTAAMAGKIILLGQGSSTVATLPTATGTGNKYEFVVSVACTSVKYAILAGSDSAYLIGNVLGYHTTTSTVFGSAASTNHSIQMPFAGTQPSGGLLGDKFIFTDIGTALWEVQGVFQGGTTATTPFSTATT